MRKYTLTELETLPTLSVGQADDLKVETDNTRVWLSRMTVEEGMSHDNQVTVQKYVDGQWVEVEVYQAK